MRIIGIALLATLAAAPVAAQDVTTPPAAAAPAEAGIETVISDQLRAFKARDLATAWSYASPGIQGMFGSADRFGQMVEGLYPMVWDNANARFVSQRRQGGTIYQQVMVQDPNGGLHLLEYAMIATDDGWRIDGVAVLPAPDVGV